MDVFENIGDEEAMRLISSLIEAGMSEEDAFTEAYSVECNKDDDCEDGFYGVCDYEK